MLYNKLFSTSHYILQMTFCLLILAMHAGAAAVPIVVSGNPRATVQIGANASTQERFAAAEIRTFIEKWTGAQLELRTNQQSTTTRTVIVLGTPTSNPTIQSLRTKMDLALSEKLGDEGYQIKSADLGTEIVIVISARTPRGVIYGAYTFIEACITELTGLKPVHPDIAVERAPSLSLPQLDTISRPFYPIRAVLEIDDPDWLARQRVNMSGGEGVWTGTGIEDGFGTAFKYVDTPAFSELQDEPRSQRLKRIETLQNRFNALRDRGIDAYLFMYLTGEPTEALIQARPDLLGPEVLYGASRNEVSYRPFCWSKPEFHTLARQLTQEIVKTYPTLAGFHLRSWGHETRACNCPECGDRSPEGQAKLWEVYFTIIKAAQEVRPDFKFYISGYNRSWLQDPDGDYARQLPKGTIFSQKWGADGEPITDPNIPIEQMNTLGEMGHRFIVLSHDVEEVMPFWMLESDLFVQGVRQLANSPEVVGLSGFTVQGATQGLGYLDRLVSARINWDMQLDHLQLMHNELMARYGNTEAADLILSALRTNGWTLASYFSDYASSLSIGGTYGSGSAGLATRFWNLIGPNAVKNTLAIPELKIAQTAVHRFTNLLAPQQRAANEIREANEIAEPVDLAAAQDLTDALHLMRLWVLLFQSREKLVEAITLGYERNTGSRINAKLASAAEFSKSIQPLIKQFNEFGPLFGYSHQTNEVELVKTLKEEVAFLSSFDYRTLQKHDETFSPEETELRISDVYNYPNPLKRKTTFTYLLTLEADAVEITIYNVSGRRIHVLKDVSAKEGYNEVSWNAQDADGTPLANGVYFYKVRAVLDDKKAESIRRLAVIR
ncbi:MAG: alpha-glucuronidase family glycosyl hydrolase [Candidatus Poribacteria bacterium]|nr:alpha-glucuronidase family glycosyl hydrolase [Candidatus Poribacteria bacterium]